MAPAHSTRFVRIDLERPPHTRIGFDATMASEATVASALDGLKRAGMTWPPLEDNTLLVEVVHEGGPIDKWNRENQDIGATLDSGDLITTINGVSGVNGMRRELANANQTSITMTVLKFPEVARKILDDLAKNPKMEFVFKIRRESAQVRLGIDTNEAAGISPDGLFIAHIVEGNLVHKINQELGPNGMTLEVGDKVISVNGYTHVDAMKDELKYSQDIEMKVQRSMRPPNTGVVLKPTPSGNVSVAGVDPGVPVKLGPLSVPGGKGGVPLPSPRPPYEPKAPAYPPMGAMNRNVEVDIPRAPNQMLGLDVQVRAPDKASNQAAGVVYVAGIVQGSAAHLFNLSRPPWGQLMVGDQINMVNGINTMQSPARLVEELKASRPNYRILYQRSLPAPSPGGDGGPGVRPKEAVDSARGVPPVEKASAKKPSEKEKMNRPAVTAMLVLKSLELSDSELTDVFTTILKERPWLKENMMQSLETIDRGVI